MNIFATYECPVRSALSLDDKRVNKMIVETAQMLSTALYVHSRDRHRECSLYSPAYMNHPCTQWARETRQNFEWLATHGLALCEIYRTVTGRVHGSFRVIWECSVNSKNVPVITPEATPFRNCTPFKFQNDTRSIHEKYRKTLLMKWANDTSKPTWKKRAKPEFLGG